MSIVERRSDPSFPYVENPIIEKKRWYGRKYYVIDSKNIPDHIIMLFFSYLPIRDFVVVGHVNKRWYDLRNVVLVVGGIEIQRTWDKGYGSKQIVEEVFLEGFFERHREVRKEVLNAFRIEYFAMREIALQQGVNIHHMDNLLDNLEKFFNMDEKISPNEDIDEERRIIEPKLERKFINDLAHQILLLISDVEKVRGETDPRKQITTENYYQDPRKMREVVEDVLKYDVEIDDVISDRTELTQITRWFYFACFIAITIVSVFLFIGVLLSAIFANFVILPKVSLRLIPSIFSALVGFGLPSLLMLAIIIGAFVCLGIFASESINKAGNLRGIDVDEKKRILLRDCLLGGIGVLLLSYLLSVTTIAFASYGSFKLSHMVSNKFLQALIFISPLIANSLIFIFLQFLLLFIVKSIIYKKFYFFDNLILKNRIRSFRMPF